MHLGSLSQVAMPICRMSLSCCAKRSAFQQIETVETCGNPQVQREPEGTRVLLINVKRQGTFKRSFDKLFDKILHAFYKFYCIAMN